MRRRLPALAGLCFFFAYSCLGIAWSMATPVNGHTDEHAHAIRAYAVATGQILGPQTASWNGFAGSEFAVPRNLLPPNDQCLYVPIRQSAACLQEPGDDTTPVVRSTWVGRYNPVYYAIAGLPMRFLSGTDRILGARVITALLSAALLAFALTICLSRRWNAVAGALVLAMTPTMVSLTGAVNPNAIEAAAAALLVATLLALPHKPSRGLFALAALSGALLINARTLGPLFFGLILATAVFAVRKYVNRELKSHPWARWTVFAWASSLLAAIAWNLVSGATSLGKTAESFSGSLAFALQSVADHRISDWASQLIGVFGYTETYLPGIIVVAWWCVVAVLATQAYQAADRNLRRLLVLLALAAPLLLLALEFTYLWDIGFSQSGRYVFPIWITALMLMGYAMPSARRMAVVVAACAAIGQVWALAEVMTRFQHGPAHVISPLGGAWTPPAGPVLVLLVAAGGALMLVVPFWIVRPERSILLRPHVPQPHVVHDLARAKQII